MRKSTPPPSKAIGRASQAPKKAQAGRRPSGSGTRDTILKVAQEHFFQYGYEGASVRAIAADAGVDPALVRHFFGSKDKLFTAVLEVPLDAYDGLNAAYEQPDGGIASFLEHYFRLWEESRTATPLLTLLRSALHSEQAMQVLQDFLSARLKETPAPVGIDQWQVRQTLIASQLLGIALSRYLLKIEPLSTMKRPELIEALIPVLKAQLAKT